MQNVLFSVNSITACCQWDDKFYAWW